MSLEPDAQRPRSTGSASESARWGPPQRLRTRAPSPARTRESPHHTDCRPCLCRDRPTCESASRAAAVRVRCAVGRVLAAPLRFLPTSRPLRLNPRRRPVSVCACRTAESSLSFVACALIFLALPAGARAADQHFIGALASVDEVLRLADERMSL